MAECGLGNAERTAALVASSLDAALTDGPGDPVILPGAEISGWRLVGDVPARFGRPASTTANVIPNPKAAAEARDAVVSFFVTNLNR
jgi:hypothetical protein